MFFDPMHLARRMRKSPRLTPTERLIKLLEAEGFENVKVMVPKGYWLKQDVHRWEAIAKKGGLPADLCSWDTVTECARRGVKIVPDERGGFGSYYAHAVEK